VATKSALNAKNLETLGLERLAVLLIEISAGNAVAKRRLRMELAGAQSPPELAKQVRKRLTIISRSRSFVDWQGTRSLADDLDIQRRAIVETVAKADPMEALDLLWRFMALAPAVLERCDDSSGTVIGVFHEACADIGDVALMAKAEAKTLADQAFAALTANDYGQFDQLIRVLAPALRRAGLEHLKQRMIDLSNRPVTKPAEKDRVKIGWSSAGPIFADEMAERSRLSTVRLALTEIADALGDVDAFMEQYEEETRKVPRIAAEIARRLLSAGRAQEAWQTIQATKHQRRNSGWDWPDFEWEDARIDVLEALGRGDDAQIARWGCFERSLSSTHLRAYLKRLSDFTDVEAEKKGAQLRAAVAQPAPRSVIPRLMACPGPRGDASAAGDDRLHLREQPLQPIPARCAPSARLLEPGIGNHGIREVRTARRLRSQITSRTSEEELVLEFDCLRIREECDQQQRANFHPVRLFSITARKIRRSSQN